MISLPAVAASDSPSRLADWLELKALESTDLNSAVQDLVGYLRQGGTVEVLESDSTAIGDLDAGGFETESEGTGAWAEILNRQESCGNGGVRYPFDLAAGSLEISTEREPEASIYVFLLILASFGPKRMKGVTQPERLFEDVASSVAHRYFGGTEGGAEVFPFGFPRRTKPAGFARALDALCSQMGEGGGSLKVPQTSNQKDAKLDIVVWKRFSDRRGSQLIGFGQCATGANWGEKLLELHPINFQRMWMREGFNADPVRLFFLPHRVEQQEWRNVGIQAGIVFDRCRIVEFAQTVPQETLRECERWTKAVLMEIRKK